MVDDITEEANPGVVGPSWTDVFWDFLCGLFYDTHEEIPDVRTKIRFVLTQQHGITHRVKDIIR